MQVSPWLWFRSMLKSHRICLRPTAEQGSLFLQHAGYARFAYNWAVGEFKAGLDVGEWLNERTLRPRWNRVQGIIAPWAAALSQNAAKYAIIDLGQAAEAWGAWRSVRLCKLVQVFDSGSANTTRDHQTQPAPEK